MPPSGPPRPWETISRSGRLRSSRRVFGIPARPAGCVGFDQVLGVIAQRLADFEDGPEFLAPEGHNPGALICRPRDLVEVAADGTEFTDDALEGGEFVLR